MSDATRVGGAGRAQINGSARDGTPLAFLGQVRSEMSGDQLVRVPASVLESMAAAVQALVDKVGVLDASNGTLRRELEATRNQLRAAQEDPARRVIRDEPLWSGLRGQAGIARRIEEAAISLELYELKVGYGSYDRGSRSSDYLKYTVSGPAKAVGTLRKWAQHWVDGGNETFTL